MLEHGLKMLKAFQLKVAGLFTEGYTLPRNVHQPAIEDIQKRLDQWQAKLNKDSALTVNDGRVLRSRTVASRKGDRFDARRGKSTTIQVKGMIEKCIPDERREGTKENCVNKHLTEDELSVGSHTVDDAEQENVKGLENVLNISDDEKCTKRRNVSGKHLQCETCNKVLKTEKGLIEHQEMHKTGPKSCPECGKILHSKSSIYVHRKMHRELLKCPDCDYTAAQKSWLQQHILAVHKKEEKYLCDVCAKAFCYESVLKRHMNALHNQGTLVHCEHCDYSTKTTQCLRRHIFNKHTTNRPKWICDLCGNIFRSKAILDDHRSLHVGEKRFKCTKCSNMFSCRSSKNRHLRTVHGEKHFPCSDCGKMFSEKVYLRRHMTIHTGEKNYSCGFCDYCCNTRGNLRKHWRVVHKKKDHDNRQRPVARLFNIDNDKNPAAIDSLQGEMQNSEVEVDEGHRELYHPVAASDIQTHVNLEQVDRTDPLSILPHTDMTPGGEHGSYNVLKLMTKAPMVNEQKSPAVDASSVIECQQQIPISDAEILISVHYPQATTEVTSNVLTSTQQERQVLEYATLQNWSEM